MGQHQVFVQPSPRPHGRFRRWKQLSWRRRLFFIFAIVLVVIGIILLLLYTQGTIKDSWISISSLILTGLSIIIALIVWLNPVDSSITPIVGPVESTQNLNINPDVFVWRERTIQEIYEKLTDSNTSAVILKGLNGVGTSTLARSIYDYVEEQRSAGVAPFYYEALRLDIDLNTTLLTLIEELCILSRRSLPDLSHFSEQRQAEQFFLYLNSPRMRRLVILDFRTPLDIPTGTVLADRPDFKKFFTILNNQPCECRILLTSNPWSVEDDDFTPDYMQEHYVRGLDETEGIELLQRCKLEGTSDELLKAVKLCDGHAGALTILRSILHQNSMDLADFLEDHTYVRRWLRDISERFLRHIYQELNPIERELLFGFSVYRKSVKIEAVVKTSGLSKDQVVLALPKLKRCNLFLDVKEKDHHQLHAVVANCIRYHLSWTGDQQTNVKKWQEADRRAAEYYQAVARNLLGQHRKSAELFIEAVWHLHKAGRDDEAYTLILQEDLWEYFL